MGRCGVCGATLVDDDGASWPYCPNCEWCPDCGVSHEPVDIHAEVFINGLEDGQMAVHRQPEVPGPPPMGETPPEVVTFDYDPTSGTWSME